ncbi:MAG: class I SAM-dependent methyltransferase [Phycisphaerae bacterium]|nr:class I SAM-dependent methyltransferase [Phycisphaerae bacterium]
MKTVCQKQKNHEIPAAIGPASPSGKYPPVRWETVPCNLCGAEDTELYHQERLVYFDQELNFQIVRCRKCSLVYTNPRLADYNALYLCDGSYSVKQIEDHASAKATVFAKAMDEIERWHATPTNSAGRASLLDVGCGSGHFMAMARNRGYDVCGIEPAKTWARYVGETFGLPVINANILDAKVVAESIDVMTAWDVIEHVDDPKAVLGQCVTWLRPGGVMALRFPSATYQKFKGVLLNQVFRTKHSAFGATMHLYFFNEDTFRQMAHDVGLEILAVKTTPMEMNTGSSLINGAKRCVGLALSAAELLSRRHLGNLEIFCRKSG